MASKETNCESSSDFLFGAGGKSSCGIEFGLMGLQRWDGVGTVNQSLLQSDTV
ncbi:MAG: hypothetical protein AAFP69_20600 [Planctomycetota bacterium]